MQPKRDLNNGTADIKQNLANLSSTTFEPDLFTASPSTGLSATKQPSILSSASNKNKLSKQHSFRAAFGMNMNGSGVFRDEFMEVTPKDRKCANISPAVNAAVNRLKKIESFSKPLY